MEKKKIYEREGKGEKKTGGEGEGREKKKE